MLCKRLGGPNYNFTAHGPAEFVDWGASSRAMKVEGAQFVSAISHFCSVQLTLAAGINAWNKIHIVGCGLDLDEFKVSNTPLSKDAPFLVIGRLCPAKAQVLIVEAVAKVAATHPYIRIQMVGDGESRADVEAAIAHHDLSEQIKLLGWCDNAEVRARLTTARALLLPSFAEGLPVVVMEAFATGRPVIPTYIAGIPELVDESCGWIVPASSVDSIAASMIAALQTLLERLRACGEEGRKRVECRHDIKKNAAKLAESFQSGVADSQTGSSKI